MTGGAAEVPQWREAVPCRHRDCTGHGGKAHSSPGMFTSSQPPSHGIFINEIYPFCIIILKRHIAEDVLQASRHRLKSRVCHL